MFDCYDTSPTKHYINQEPRKYSVELAPSFGQYLYQNHTVKLCSTVTILLQRSIISIRNHDSLCRTCTFLRSISLSNHRVKLCYTVHTSPTKRYINQEPRQSLSNLHPLTFNIVIKITSCVEMLRYFSKEALHQSGTTKDCRTCTLLRSISLSNHRVKLCYTVHTSPTKRYINQKPRQTVELSPSYAQYLYQNHRVKLCSIVTILLQQSAESIRNHERLSNLQLHPLTLSVFRKQRVAHRT